MKISKIFEKVAVTGEIPDGEINHICCDTRQITEGSAFFCLKGFNSDGHDFAKKANELGASLIVCERDTGEKNQLLVKDSHEAFALCCANLFGNPQEKLKLIGVTGTNGKTTITHLIHDVLERMGHKAGLIGTIKTDIGDMKSPSKYTTPDPLSFYSLLSQMVEAKCEYAVMEVSSHGLDQKRVAGCVFDVAVFTNLTQDHLDYHKSMENYYEAKKRLFSICKKAVINFDDTYGRRLYRECTCEKRSFAVSRSDGDYTAKNIEMKASGSKFAFVGNGVISRVKFPVPGEFSISNAMAAICALTALGLPLEAVCESLADTEGVPGRFEVLKTDTPYTVIRDYAHSPDAIEKVLTALRAVTNGRIIILFGCAGNRDRKKRRIMAEAAARLSDFAILTSDNPRDEDPMQIIDDARPGLLEHETPNIIIPDRYEAIGWALENCKEGDTLLLAGKGHEDYQVLSHATIHFDEKEIVAELLKKRG